MLTGTITYFPVLTTERLRLRKLVSTDDQKIFILRSDPEVNKYLDRKICDTVEDARNFINNVKENVDKGDSLYWAITLIDNDILVGTVCLFGFSDENDKCEIGYELLTDFIGQGIMKEAVEKVIDYAFNEIKVKEIEACLHKDNQSSIKLLQKFAFRSSNAPGNTESDVICYHLTAA